MRRWLSLSVIGCVIHAVLSTTLLMIHFGASMKAGSVDDQNPAAQMVKAVNLPYFLIWKPAAEHFHPSPTPIPYQKTEDPTYKMEVEKQLISYKRYEQTERKLRVTGAIFSVLVSGSIFGLAGIVLIRNEK